MRLGSRVVTREGREGDALDGLDRLLAEPREFLPEAAHPHPRLSLRLLLKHGGILGVGHTVPLTGDGGAPQQPLGMGWMNDPTWIGKYQGWATPNLPGATVSM